MRGLTRFTFAVLVMLSGLVSVGCSSEPKDPFESWDAKQKYRNYVPQTAMPLTSGVGTLTATVPEDGVVYLIDLQALEKVEQVEKPKVLIAGGLRKGSVVIFEPDQRRIYLKGREGVRLTEVNAQHKHELRLDPDAKAK